MELDNKTANNKTSRKILDNPKLIIKEASEKGLSFC
jgi:hypothetical protein